MKPPFEGPFKDKYVGRSLEHILCLQSYATVFFCFFSSPLPIRALVLDSRDRGLSGPASFGISQAGKARSNLFLSSMKKRLQNCDFFSIHHPYVMTSFIRYPYSVLGLDRYEWLARLIVLSVLLSLPKRLF